MTSDEGIDLDTLPPPRAAIVGALDIRPLIAVIGDAVVHLRLTSLGARLVPGTARRLRGVTQAA